MLERLGGGAVGGPIVLVLVQVLDALQNHNQAAEAADDGDGKLESRQDGYGRRHDDLYGLN